MNDGALSTINGEKYAGEFAHAATADIVGFRKNQNINVCGKVLVCLHGFEATKGCGFEILLTEGDRDGEP